MQIQYLSDIAKGFHMFLRRGASCGILEKTTNIPEDCMRDTKHDIMKEMRTRFANRALLDKEVPADTLEALVEAATLAPSCFNEQPWRFLRAQGADFEALLGCLTEKNQSWAKRAGTLVLLISKKTFTQGGKPNPWHLSDAGCAAGFLFLEAERRGLYAHPMGGFVRDKARAVFDVPEDYAVVEVIAIGEPGDKALLSPALQQDERPKPRMPYHQLMDF